MKQYTELVHRIMEEGVARPDRTGVGTLSVFGHQMRFLMADGFPLLTTKRVPLRLPLAEALWMLSGSGHVSGLHALDAHFWDKWADANGDLGRVYGVQWRAWRKYWREGPIHPSDDMVELVVEGKVDQVAEAVRLLREDPYSRRILVSAWNPGEMDEMALPPCPFVHQLYVADGRLSLVVIWRSVDVGIGMPFDIAVYALLLHMYAALTGLEPYELICWGHDVHIYNNHLVPLAEQVTRSPRRLPTLTLVKKPHHHEMWDFEMEDFILNGYDPHPHIPMEANI